MKPELGEQVKQETVTIKHENKKSKYGVLILKVNKTPAVSSWCEAGEPRFEVQHKTFLPWRYAPETPFCR